MQCRDFREIVDSYLSDELLVETNHSVIKHLESCVDCCRELTARRELRHKLRDGFQLAPELQVSEEFAGQLRAQLRDIALLRSRFSAVNRSAHVALAASLVIAAALGFSVVYQRWHSQYAPYSTAQIADEKVDRELSDHRHRLENSALTQSAIGDHRDCALSHRLEEKPIDLEEAGRKYDPAYINLVNAVTSGLPSGLELVAGHSCVFKGRRFGHVILKYRGRIVSVLVTNIDAHDRGTQAGSESTIAGEELHGLYVVHFETSQHAVYFVSEISDTETLSIAKAIAPSLSRHLRGAERGTAGTRLIQTVAEV